MKTIKVRTLLKKVKQGQIEINNNIKAEKAAKKHKRERNLVGVVGLALIVLLIL